MPAEREVTKPTGAVHIPRRAFYVVQVAAVTVLIALAVAHYILAARHGNSTLELMTRMFDLNLENSVPTWFSMLNLLIASVLLFAIYRHGKERGDPLTVYWLKASFSSPSRRKKSSGCTNGRPSFSRSPAS